MEPRRNLLTRRVSRPTVHRTLRRNVGMRHLSTDNRYLESVRISDTAALETALKDAFGVRTFSDIRDQVRTAIQTVRAAPSECTSRSEWVSCLNTCQTTLSKCIQTELSSTAYMLRILTKSVMSVDGSTIEFVATAPLTGVWNRDADHIRIQSLNRDTAPSRLILGLGPSASGKTYWAKSLIAMLSASNEEFPKTFLSIDGGIYREASLVYQYILEGVKSICVAGLDNLVLSSWKLTKSSMFNTNVVKKAVVHFLKRQTLPLSLYVPETLGDCGHGRLKSCSAKLTEFQTITKDTRWIAILIWQHKYASECAYSPLYKCTGCTESGTVREKEEGKKYSNGAYTHSMDEGITVLDSAPGGSYRIHNSGHPRRKSILVDTTHYEHQGNVRIQNILASATNMTKYNYVYRRLRRADNAPL